MQPLFSDSSLPGNPAVFKYNGGYQCQYSESRVMIRLTELSTILRASSMPEAGIWNLERTLASNSTSNSIVISISIEDTRVRPRRGNQTIRN